MLRIAQMIKPEEIPNSFRPSVQSLSTRPRRSADGSILLGMKNRRKASFKINDPVAAQIFGLFVSDALQRILGLHYRDGMCESLQIFRQASLIGSADKTIRRAPEGHRWKVCVFRISGQFDDCLRPQHAIQVLVQKDFGKTLQ